MTSQTLPSHQCSACLIAGKSPAYWRRDLSRKTTRFNIMRRTCNGLQMPTGSVRLQQEPLLGSCLAALTGGNINGSVEKVHRASHPKPERSRQFLPPSTHNQSSVPEARSQQQPMDNACPPSKLRSRQQPASNLVTGANPCSAQVPLKLEPQASSDLLCQWVNDSMPARIDTDSPAKPEPQLSEPLPPPRSHNDRSVYQPPRSPRVHPLPACPDAIQRRGWLDRLAQHTDRRFHRNASAPGSTAVQPGQMTQTAPTQSTQGIKQDTQSRSSAPTVQDLPLEQQSVGPIAPPVQGGDRPLTENLLTEQWSRPIAGQTAPIDLLVYLAERTVSTISPQEADGLPSDRASNASVLPGGDRSSTAPTTNGYGGYSQSLDQWFTPSLTAQRDRAVPSHRQQTRQSDGERTWTGNGAQARSPERSPNQPALASSPMPAMAGYEPSAITTRANESYHPSLPLIPLTNPSASTPPIAPPAVTPSLPALTAPQTGDSPTPSVASALTQHQAQQEAIAPADLGLLADQIKRILNEEARRHGINL